MLIPSIAALMPNRWRETWRNTQRRLAALEKNQQEIQMFLDLVLADAVHSESCEVGMHAQTGRRAVVEALFGSLNLQAAVETGTYIGRTTNYLARTFKVPVYSSELVPRYHHAARRMLRGLDDVHLSLADSRRFLKGLAADERLTSQRAFFYLDAHWYNDLPLADEIDIIAKGWRDYAILIDDFRVPDDDGYVYDDYGPGKALDMEYLNPVLQRNGLDVFFPSVRAADETGGRAGYAVVLPKHLSGAADAIAQLRRHGRP